MEEMDKNGGADMYGLELSELDLMKSFFSKTNHLDKVILYGSRAKGNYKPFSDVDITLIGDGLQFSDLSALQDMLYYSNLPYFYDVSIFNEISNPALKDHIARRGLVIYER